MHVVKIHMKTEHTADVGKESARSESPDLA